MLARVHFADANLQKSDLRKSNVFTVEKRCLYLVRVRAVEEPVISNRTIKYNFYIKVIGF